MTLKLESLDYYSNIDEEPSMDVPEATIGLEESEDCPATQHKFYSHIVGPAITGITGGISLSVISYYLMTFPDDEVSEETQKNLETLRKESRDRLTITNELQELIIHTPFQWDILLQRHVSLLREYHKMISEHNEAKELLLNYINSCESLSDANKSLSDIKKTLTDSNNSLKDSNIILLKKNEEVTFDSEELKQSKEDVEASRKNILELQN